MAVLQYMELYNTAEKQDLFIPGETVTVCISTVQNNRARLQCFTPYLYEIELQHGPYRWTIRKNIRDFRNLHTRLKLATMKKTITGAKDELIELPTFPKRPEFLVFSGEIQKRRKRLEEYLQKVVECNYFRNNSETLEFLEVSRLSFINELGQKFKEGKIRKRKWDQKFIPFCRGADNMMRKMCGHWHGRWLIVKDNYLCHLNPKTGELMGVMLIDKGLEVKTIGMFKNKLRLRNLSRKMVIACGSNRKAEEWKEVITQHTAHDFFQRNRYNSYGLQRHGARGTWYVDGCDYMAAVADALLEAKQEIFITDWWLTPEVYLKRPITEDDRWRLDIILQKKAEEGVKVFVLLYKDIEKVVGINTSYSKHALQEKHSNIKVLRHPDVVKGDTLFWSHHEKMVVIDQTYAFIGGIDLCFGRWDDHRHKLTDPNMPTISSIGGVPRIVSASMPGTTDLMKSPAFQLASNWAKLAGQSTSSSQPKSSEVQGEDVVDKPEEVEKPEEDATDSHAKLRQKISAIQRIKTRFKKKGKAKQSGPMWVGKDYCNFYVEDILNVDAPYEDTVDRATTVRVPWHDIALAVEGEAARDVARHFIQRWNHVKVVKARKDPLCPFLLPKSYERAKDPPPLIRDKTYNISCQIVRSSASWSAGLSSTEDSIQQAYVSAIQAAEHYIYIENQFFVTLGSGNGTVLNRIHEAVYHRIVKAHKQKETFRVYIVVPLMPGFKGRYGDPSSSALHAVTNWNYTSMCRGPHSLIQRLKDAGINNPDDYVCFCSLRASGELQGYMVTELIYIHSKLMIVDDKLVICGSANINDRSLMGDRDSEIAAVIEDTNFVPSHMDGQPYEAGRFAGSLRKHLFMEHLGLLEGDDSSADPLDKDVSDPVHSSFYNDIWWNTARRNTNIFEEVYNCIPSNNIHSFKDLSTLKEHMALSLAQPEVAKKRLKDVKGNLVIVPLEFLKDQDLTPPPGTMEFLLPDSIFI